MHKCTSFLLSILVVFVIGGMASAQEDSITQMKLVKSRLFLERVQYLAWDEASTILAEAENTACHAERVGLANQILSAESPGAAAARLAMGVARSNESGRVILGTVIENNNLNLVNSSATDLAVTAALQFYWNDVARCDTGV